jgi:hypothetical protein
VGHHIRIMTKPGCHLCDDMKDLVRRVLAKQGGAWADASIEEIDITSDPEVEREYGLEIPVLWIDGRKAAKYRTSEAELVRKLERTETNQN